MTQPTDKIENWLFLSEVANNKDLLEKYPKLGNPKQAIGTLRFALYRGKLSGKKTLLNGIDSWQVDVNSRGFSDWYSVYTSQSKVIGKTIGKDEVNKMIVSQANGFNLISPVGDKCVVENPPVKDIPQTIVDALSFKKVVGHIKNAKLSKGTWNVNLYGCVGDDEKAHFEVWCDFMSDEDLKEGGYYHLARYELLNTPAPFRNPYYECCWSHSEVTDRIPNRVLPVRR